MEDMDAHLACTARVLPPRASSFYYIDTLAKKIFWFIVKYQSLITKHDLSLFNPRTEPPPPGTRARTAP